MGFKLGTDTPQSAIIAVILEDQAQAVAMWQALLASYKASVGDGR